MTGQKDKKVFLDSKILAEDMQDIFCRPMPWESLRESAVLVTGATGMLASYLVYFLIWLNEEQYFDMKIIVFLRSQEKGRLRFGTYMDKQYFRVLEQDVTQPINLEEQVDYIIHAASLASPQYYGSKPVEVAAPNVLGTYNLLQLANRKQVKGVLYFSSGDVYGQLPSGMGKISESTFGVLDPLDAHSCYGESKRMGETFCAAFVREYGVPVRIARIAHTYGPTMDMDHDPRVFSDFMRCVLEGKDIVMLSDGSAMRPFCYLSDAVAGFLLILLAGSDGEAYNVCNEDAFISIAELAEMMVKLRPELDLKVVRKERSQKDNYLECTANRANLPSAAKLRALGWICRHDVSDGFGRVLDYYHEKGK